MCRQGSGAANLRNRLNQRKEQGGGQGGISRRSLFMNTNLTDTLQANSNPLFRWIGQGMEKRRSLLGGGS